MSFCSPKVYRPAACAASVSNGIMEELAGAFTLHRPGRVAAATGFHLLAANRGGLAGRALLQGRRGTTTPLGSQYRQTGTLDVWHAWTNEAGNGMIAPCLNGPLLRPLLLHWKPCWDLRLPRMDSVSGALTCASCGDKLLMLRVFLCLWLIGPGRPQETFKHQLLLSLLRKSLFKWSMHARHLIEVL